MFTGQIVLRQAWPSKKTVPLSLVPTTLPPALSRTTSPFMACRSACSSISLVTAICFMYGPTDFPPWSTVTRGLCTKRLGSRSNSLHKGNKHLTSLPISIIQQICNVLSVQSQM